MSEDLVTVSPSSFDLSLARLRRCPSAAVKAMIGSLERRGQVNPVVAAGSRRHLILVDGFKRRQAAAAIGMEKVRAVIVPVHGPAMKAHVYLLNRNEGFTLMEECLLVRELVEVDGLKQVDVAAMMERHKSWASRRLEMARRLDPQVIEDIRVGLLPAGSARSLARLHQCNQVDVAAAIQRDKLRVKEIHGLVDLWCKAESPEQKRFIVESSRKALDLSSSRACSPDPRLGAHLVGFFNAVQGLERAALHLKHGFQNGLGAMNGESEAILEAALNRAEDACREAVSRAAALVHGKEMIQG